MNYYWTKDVKVSVYSNNVFISSKPLNIFDVFSRGSAPFIIGICRPDIVKIIKNRHPEIEENIIKDDVSKIRSFLLKRGYLTDVDKGVETSDVVDVSRTNRVDITRADVELTRNCNLCCKYCYASAGKNYPECSGKTWITNLKKMYDQGLKSVVISGGEPTIHKDFKMIFEYCADKFITTLNTNGTTINDTFAKWLHDLDLQVVQVSLDSPSPDIHDSNRGEGSWIRAKQALELLYKYDVPRRISCTVNYDNYHHKDEMVQLAKDLDADLAFDVMKPVGNAIYNYNNYLSATDSERVQKESVYRICKTLSPLSVSCQAQIGFVGISYDCKIKPCNLTEKFFDRHNVMLPIESMSEYSYSSTYLNINEAANNAVDSSSSEFCILKK